MKSFQAQTHYEVLEISVGATLAEIRSAHDRLTTLYADDQVALYGLIDPSRAAALRARLEEALDVLTDEQRRDAYDLKIGLPPRLVIKPPPAPRPPAPPAAASAGTAWGGAIAWVTPTAPTPATSQPNAYTYAVTPPSPFVAAPPPVMVVPVPARILAEPSSPPEPLAEPRQLAFDVAPGVPSWAARSAPPPEPLPPVAAVVEDAPPEPVATPEAEVPDVIGPPPEAPPAPAPVPAAPEPEKKPPLEKPPVEEPPIPILGDDVQVAIVPARATPSREFRVEQKPRPYEIPEGVEINGDLLKQVRLAKGLSLVQLADRTRIGVKHLENVEGDRYDALPAPVYLRGILMNLARELGLDGLRVSKSYLTFVEAHRSKG